MAKARNKRRKTPTVVGYGVEIGGVVYLWASKRGAETYAVAHDKTVLTLIPAQEYVKFVKGAKP